MPFGALLPKEYSFFDFFEQHAGKCVEGARLLLQLLKNVQDAEALAKEIKEVEHAGDKIPITLLKHCTRRSLPPLIARRSIN
jgi:uncharacterized protein Yka (UPF0111/DUF47 family)